MMLPHGRMLDHGKQYNVVEQHQSQVTAVSVVQQLRYVLADTHHQWEQLENLR